MTTWSAAKARQVLAALQRIGWTVKRQSDSHRTLARSGSLRLVVENGGHELLTAGVVRDAVVDFLNGRDVSGRHLRVDPPRFLSIEEALRPPRRPGF